VWVHGVNVLLHAAASALVAWLLWRLDAGAWAAAAAGALFAVHPVHVEAVANGVGRAELLATLGVLLACHVHLSRRGSAALRLAAIAALYLLALGAKEIAVSLPALLLVAEAVARRRERVPARRLLAGNLAMLGVTALVLGVYLALRGVALGATVGTDPAPYLRELSTADRLATAVRLWPEYLRLLLWPADLSADWGPDAIVPVGWGSPLAWAGLALGVVLAACAWASWRRSRWVAAAVLWLAASVFPVSHLPFSVGVMVAERNLYLASVAVAFLVAGAAGALAKERRDVRRAAVAGVAGLVALGAVRTWGRTPVWRSSNAVFDAMVEEHPEIWWVEWRAGQLLMQAGRVDEAIPWYRKALAKTRYNHNVMAMDYVSLLLALRRLDEAEPILRHTLAQFPDSPPAYLYLTSVRIDQGRFREAVELSHRAAAVPRFGPVMAGHVQHRLALAYDGLGRRDSALAARRATLAIPDQRRLSNVWYHYARLLALAGDSAAAAAALDSARARVPPDQRRLLTLHPVPPLTTARVLGWGALAAPGAAPGPSPPAPLPVGTAPPGPR
jgi:tetratricopeptide (TPR) repeat protein